jgi:uncharacterized membrane protein YcaP (DUF421 family)
MQSDTTAIRIFDLQRMLLGDLPWMFTFEVIVRTVVIYVYTLFMVRLLSKRAVGQLSLVEFLLVIALGSAVGDPMFYHDVPLLHGIAVITVVVLLDRVLAYYITHSEVVERLLEGAPCTVVHDGVMLPKGLSAAGMNREELFQFLRLQGVEHLGQVRAAYVEQTGHVSVFCYPPQAKRLGMRTMPPWDVAPPLRFACNQQVEQEALLACELCGSVQQFYAGQTLPNCASCGAQTWVDAVYTPSP